MRVAGRFALLFQVLVQRVKAVEFFFQLIHTDVRVDALFGRITSLLAFALKRFGDILDLVRIVLVAGQQPLKLTAYDRWHELAFERTDVGLFVDQVVDQVSFQYVHVTIEVVGVEIDVRASEKEIKP